jgi:hypothetical protein
MECVAELHAEARAEGEKQKRRNFGQQIYNLLQNLGSESSLLFTMISAGLSHQLVLSAALIGGGLCRAATAAEAERVRRLPAVSVLAGTLRRRRAKKRR